MAAESRMSETSMRRLAKCELKFKSYHLLHRHFISEATAKKRLDRAKSLLGRIQDGTLINIIFSDEKLFTIERSYNRQNDRILGTGISSLPKTEKTVTRKQGPPSVMVWAAASETGRSPLVFVNPGVKINANYYVEAILEKGLLPWAKKIYKKRRFTFQQDGAPAHTSRLAQSWCQEKLPAFISKEEWPPSSPDLNPLDFSLWAILEAKACAKEHTNLEALKRSLIKAWESIPEEQVRTACAGFQDKLKKVVMAKGWYIE